MSGGEPWWLIMPSDAREERTRESIWAEELDDVSCAATAAAADFLGSSVVTWTAVVDMCLVVYMTGAD